MKTKIKYSYFYASTTTVMFIVISSIVMLLALYLSIFGSEREIETAKRPFAFIMGVAWLVLVGIIAVYAHRKRKERLNEVREIIEKGKVIEGVITARSCERVGNWTTGDLKYYYEVEYKDPKTHTKKTGKSHYLAVFRNVHAEKYPLKVKLFYYKGKIYADEIIDKL